MNNYEYFKEVRSTAEYIVDTVSYTIDHQPWADTMEQGYRAEMTQEMLFETIDSHEWIIYTHYHLQILENSPNADYMVDNIGDADNVLKEQGIAGLHQALAFWAFYADVQEALYDIME